MISMRVSMSKKQRSNSKFSFFSKLFARNETEYPPALDGRVTPWIVISKSKNKSIQKMFRVGQNWKPVSAATSLKISGQQTNTKKNIKLPPLDMQLKKSRLVVILKNSKPLKKRQITEAKVQSNPLPILNKQGVILRHNTKILAL